MSTVVSIRAAEAADASAISTLTEQLGYASTLEAADVSIRAMADDDDHRLLVAVDGETVCGWLHAAVVVRVGLPAFVEIDGMVVDLPHRGRGIGGMLLAAAKVWARGREVTKVRVRTRTEREDARGFYENAAFEAVKSQVVYDHRLGR